MSPLTPDPEMVGSAVVVMVLPLAGAVMVGAAGGGGGLVAVVTKVPLAPSLANWKPRCRGSMPGSPGSHAGWPLDSLQHAGRRIVAERHTRRGKILEIDLVAADEALELRPRIGRGPDIGAEGCGIVDDQFAAAREIDLCARSGGRGDFERAARLELEEAGARRIDGGRCVERARNVERAIVQHGWLRCWRQ